MRPASACRGVESRGAWGGGGKAQRGEDHVLGASKTDNTTTSVGSGSSMEEEAGSRRAAAAAAKAEHVFEESRPVEPTLHYPDVLSPQTKRILIMDGESQAWGF